MKIVACIVSLTLLCTGLVQAGGATPNAADVARNLLPLPQTLKLDAGTLLLNKETTLSLDAESTMVGQYFAVRLRRGTGWPAPVTANAIIRFEVVPDAKISPEAYTLQITPTHITLRATSAVGIAHGAEALFQLMPPAVYGVNQCQTIPLPALTITDAPQFAWRGLMLDVSRKFQNKDTILKLLDGMAACKLNIFHWHLTDDQGWRLPIEGYPKLTEKGPAYSCADVHEIVTHATELGITILPEIDMPGHSGASCHAYPQISILNDKGNPTGTINPGADATYAFIQAIMADIATQFPDSPYVHIGQDEVGAGGWAKDAQCQALMQREKLKNTRALGDYFINRIVGIAKQNHKKCIAWDEALDRGIDPALAIMCWHGMTVGMDAAKSGHDVVFCPDPQLYFDHPNSRSKRNLPGYSANTSYLNSVYFFNAALPALSPADRAHILGGQGCLWSEVVRNADHMCTMMFPRACALGETLWTPRDQLDWPSFLDRLALQRQRFDAMHIPYFWDPDTLAINIGSWKPAELTAAQGIIEFPLTGKLRNPGLQEFFIAQGPENGRFRIDAVELLKNGAVVDQDRHSYESSIYTGANCLYLVKTPDLAGTYTLRIHVTPLSGATSATVQLIPALSPDQYSKQGAPDGGSNRTKQTATH